jgi:hypothetical protein
MASWLESQRLRQIEALKAATGSWKDEDHPELVKGAALHVSQSRHEGERRFEALVTRTK